MNPQGRKRIIQIAADLANGAPLDKLFSTESHAAVIGRKTIRILDLAPSIDAAHDMMQALAVELRAIADRAQQEKSK